MKLKYDSCLVTDSLFTFGKIEHLKTLLTLAHFKLYHEAYDLRTEITPLQIYISHYKGVFLE